MPCYADVHELSLIEEVHAKLSGRFTFNLIHGVGLWLRDVYGINRKGPVVAEHIHRNGFYERQRPCPIAISAREIDSKDVPF